MNDPVYQTDCERCGRGLFDTTGRRFWALCDDCADRERRILAQRAGHACPECRGIGHVTLDAYAPGERSYWCPECDGAGDVIDDERFRELMEAKLPGPPQAIEL